MAPIANEAAEVTTIGPITCGGGPFLGHIHFQGQSLVAAKHSLIATGPPIWGTEQV